MGGSMPAIRVAGVSEVHKGVISVRILLHNNSSKELRIQLQHTEICIIKKRNIHVT